MPWATKTTDGNRTIKPWSKNMINILLFFFHSFTDNWSSSDHNWYIIAVGPCWILWNCTEQVVGTASHPTSIRTIHIHLVLDGLSSNESKETLSSRISEFLTHFFYSILFLLNVFLFFSFVLCWWSLFAYSSLYADGLLQCVKAFLLTWRYT